MINSVVQLIPPKVTSNKISTAKEAWLYSGTYLFTQGLIYKGQRSAIYKNTAGMKDDAITVWEFPSKLELVEQRQASDLKDKKLARTTCRIRAIAK